MAHFVRVIFDREVNISESLNESIFPNNELLETKDGGTVLHIPLERVLTDDESDEFADKLANYMFEQGHDNFDIEVSMEEQS
jgi:hypothetical protein